MILIAGLGNPEKQYDNTRHNIGFMAADRLRAELAPTEKWSPSAKLHGEIIKSGNLILLKPTTYMNLSGRAIKATAQMYKINPADIWILHDELDLEFGRIKIQVGGGAAGHNGIKSIVESIGTPEFIRWRVGIGRPPGEIPSADYVLDKFTVKEEPTLHEILNRLTESVNYALQNTVIATMNKYN